MIGNLYRICEEPQKAFDYLHECLDISLVEGDIKKEFKIIGTKPLLVLRMPVDFKALGIALVISESGISRNV